MPYGEIIDPEDMELRKRVDQPMYRHRNQEYGPVERVDMETRYERRLPPFEGSPPVIDPMGRQVKG